MGMGEDNSKEQTANSKANNMQQTTDNRGLAWVVGLRSIVAGG
jgi:hypothetical protein